MTNLLRNPGDGTPKPGTTANVTRSAVMYRLGGREYPMHSVPQCKVCQSHSRVDIERALLKSYGYTAIWKSLPEREQQTLSIKNITDHAHQHLPVDESIRRSVVEARAREIGIDIEGSEASLVDHISFAKVGLQDVYDRMVNGELVPDVKDGIAFATMLMKVNEVAGEGVDQDAINMGFMGYLMAIKAVCTDEQMNQIKNTLSRDPVMKALWNRHSPSLVIDQNGLPS